LSSKFDLIYSFIKKLIVEAPDLIMDMRRMYPDNTLTLLLKPGWGRAGWMHPEI